MGLRSLSILFGLLAISCGGLAKLEGQRCDIGSDCVWPAVCCTETRFESLGESAAVCEDVKSCNDFMPFLLEGDPCNRTNSPYSACQTPLVCCPQTLGCMTQTECAEVPEPAEMTGSGDTCTADGDCGEGEVCMNIDMRVRDGRCESLSTLRTMPQR